MGNSNITTKKVTLVVFTCEGREHLLIKTIKSFNNHSNFTFDQIILVIDGNVNLTVSEYLQPDLIIQECRRKGYVNNIGNLLKLIANPYFFWLEDDWTFNSYIPVKEFLLELEKNQNWTQIILSKFGPLSIDQKKEKLHQNFYKSNFGFSANPSLCNTIHLQSAFIALNDAPKGDQLGEDGFENYFTKYFANNMQICAISDPQNSFPIAHEGYLETTPRNWHMTNSLNTKTKKHLLTIPSPSLKRRLIMIIKLTYTFCTLAFEQLFSEKIYEYCFRIIATAKNIKKDG